MSLPVLEIEGHAVTFSLHACRRWRVRRRPLLGFAAAVAELETEVARHGRLETRRPRGFEVRGLHHMLETVAWLTLDETTAFPLAIDCDLVRSFTVDEHGQLVDRNGPIDPRGQWVATTCLVIS